jgi:uncharacterized protein (DUF924 family)
MELAGRVLEFWFGTGEDVYQEAWFKKDPEFDKKIDQQFGRDREIAATGGHDAMAETAEGALALVILLDQFSRNLLRGSPDAFACDPKALGLAKSAIERGFDMKFPTIRRSFFYLPFEHSETLADQERGIELFTALGDENMLKYMTDHRDIVALFGRFPHRNEVLGRESTAEELDFLKSFSSF